MPDPSHPSASDPDGDDDRYTSREAAVNFATYLDAIEDPDSETTAAATEIEKAAIRLNAALEKEVGMTVTERVSLIIGLAVRVVIE